MHQLVYISTMRRLIEPAELQEILDTSIRNNGRVGVSGLLIVGGNRFLQALEGPTQAVLQTYDRIRKDERHFACVTLTSRSIAQREFGHWSMAHERGSDCGGNGSLADVVQTLTAGLADRDLQAQLRGFAELHAAS